MPPPAGSEPPLAAPAWSRFWRLIGFSVLGPCWQGSAFRDLLVPSVGFCLALPFGTFDFRAWRCFPQAGALKDKLAAEASFSPTTLARGNSSASRASPKVPWKLGRQRRLKTENWGGRGILKRKNVDSRPFLLETYVCHVRVSLRAGPSGSRCIACQLGLSVSDCFNPLGKIYQAHSTNECFI